MIAVSDMAHTIRKQHFVLQLSTLKSYFYANAEDSSILNVELRQPFKFLNKISSALSHHYILTIQRLKVLVQNLEAQARQVPPTLFIMLLKNKRSTCSRFLSLKFI